MLFCHYTNCQRNSIGGIIATRFETMAAETSVPFPLVLMTSLALKKLMAMAAFPYLANG